MDRLEGSQSLEPPTESQAGPSQEGRPGTYYPAARCKLCHCLFPMKPRAEGRGRKQAWEFCKLTHYSIYWTLYHPRKLDEKAGEKAVAEWRQYQLDHASEIEAARAKRVENIRRAKARAQAEKLRQAKRQQYMQTPAQRANRNAQRRRNRLRRKLGIPPILPPDPGEFVPTRAQLDAINRRKRNVAPYRVSGEEPKYQPPEPRPNPWAPPEQEASNPPPITPVDTQHKEGRLVEPEIRQQTAPISSCRLCQAAGKPCRVHASR